MALNVKRGRLDGVLLIEPAVFSDARGAFAEAYRRNDYGALGLPEFVQDNVVVSRRAVLRGLHFQHPHAQGKLIYVTHGTIFDVGVDVRAGSATFGQWEAVELSGENLRQVYLPPGFAHGYQVVSEQAVVVYNCTSYYEPASEFVLSWRDPALAIPWPIDHPLTSDKDERGLALGDLPKAPVARVSVGSR
jgi:dTDP-4-dehydrorhamnose 3,5-epimerase